MGKRMTIGQLMSLSRELKGYSLRELNRRSGVSHAIISQIETGYIKRPSFYNIVQLARALNVDLNRLAATQLDGDKDCSGL